MTTQLLQHPRPLSIGNSTRRQRFCNLACLLPADILWFADYFDEETLQDLRAEAERVRIGRGNECWSPDSDGTEGRGGFPARAYRSGPGGDLHWGLHGCQQMAETLAGVCGLDVSASGSGTYSYYEQPGDFLAVHRDVDAVRYRRHHVAHPVQRPIPRQASWSSIPI